MPTLLNPFSPSLLINQVQMKPAGKTAAAVKNAPSCPTPPPTPSGGRSGYSLYGDRQRLVDGVLVGYTGAGRQLTEAESEQADACWALCSGAGYVPPFYFSTQLTAEEACYCSQEGYVRRYVCARASTMSECRHSQVNALTWTDCTRRQDADLRCGI